VSLACDACRASREKCDGGQPQCETCVSQNRVCSYTPASKKRGIQTGYLRAIEISLAWIFDQLPESEDVLHRLLTQRDGARGARMMWKDDKVAHRLQKRWTESRINKELGRLLSSSGSSRTDTSVEGSDTEGDVGEESPPMLSSNPPFYPRPWRKVRREDNAMPSSYDMLESNKAYSSPMPLKLPANWQYLLDIYFTYTDCWLPILDRNTITTTALSYPAAGIDFDARGNTVYQLPSSHAQLWAAMAVATPQKFASSNHTNEAMSTPGNVFSTARNLLPSEAEQFELPHISALLLHSLVLLGQGRGFAAWLLIGNAVRLALHLQRAGETNSTRPDYDSLQTPESRVMAACGVLDTFVSSSLGQPSHMNPASRATFRTTMVPESPSPMRQWTPIPGIGPSSDTLGRPSEASGPSWQPLHILEQLYKFSRILGAKMEAESHERSAFKSPSPDDLVRCLDAQYSFCKTLVFGESTPRIPSAFLLQAAFLAITIELVPAPRASILSSFIETIDSCISNFGACGTPPILVTLLEIVSRQGRINKLHDLERSKFISTSALLKFVWQHDLREDLRASDCQHSSEPGSLTSYQPMGQTSSTLPTTLPGYGQRMSGTAYSGELQSSSREHELSRTEHAIQQPLSTYDGCGSNIAPHIKPAAGPPVHAVVQNMPFQPATAMRGHAPAVMRNLVPSNPHIDFETILEELGSIDYTDSVDGDPQFMANLGFAPGCDVGEMLQRTSEYECTG
jgi:hypothetical protein